MKRVAFFTLVFFFLSSVFAACCLSTSCGCGSVEGSAYKVTGFEHTLVEYTDDANDLYPYDNPALPLNASTAYNQFIFVFTPTIATIAFERNLLHSAATFAYACDPAYLPSQEYLSIKVTSTADYQTAAHTFAAGSDLISLVDLHNIGTQASFSPGDAIAYDQPSFLRLNTPPVSPSTHQFTFTFKLNDGSEIVITSASIEIF